MLKIIMEIFKLAARLGIKPKNVLGMGGDIVKMGKSLFNTKANPKLLEYIAKNQKIPAKIIEDISLHMRTMKNASKTQLNLLRLNLKDMIKAKFPPKANILNIKTGKKIPAAGIKQLETKVGYPKNVHPQSTLGKAIDESRTILSAEKAKVLKDFKASYPKHANRLKGDETASEIKEIMFRLDTEGIPFATGGIANHFRSR